MWECCWRRHANTRSSARIVAALPGAASFWPELRFGRRRSALRVLPRHTAPAAPVSTRTPELKDRACPTPGALVQQLCRAIGRHGSHVRSSVITETGPVSLALAMSPEAPEVGGVGLTVGELSPLPCVKSSVAPTEMAITNSPATAIKSHFKPLPLFGGGPGSGAAGGAPPLSVRLTRWRLLCAWHGLLRLPPPRQRLPRTGSRLRRARRIRWRWQTHSHPLVSRKSQLPRLRKAQPSCRMLLDSTVHQLR